MNGSHIGSTEVRQARLADLPFIDHLHRRENDAIGFWPRAALEGKIAKKEAFVGRINGEATSFLLATPFYRGNPRQGAIYAACVQYDARRRAVATSLIEAYLATLDPEALSVSLWCNSELEANLFWACRGFEPQGYRYGGSARPRKHILWQKALRPGAPLPSRPVATRGGFIGDIRTVLPLPEGWTVGQELICPPSPHRLRGRDRERAAMAYLASL